MPISIGRDDENDLPIEDNRLSRRHCRIVEGSDGIAVEDLASSNGTYVNGERADRVLLNLGDTVRIGFTDLNVEWDPTGGAKGRGRRGRLDAEQSRALIAENHRLHRVLSLTKAVASAGDEETLLRLIVDSALEITGAERAFLFLVTLRGLHFRVARDRDHNDLEDPQEMISQSIASEAVETGRPVVTDDAGGDARFSGGQSVAYLRIRSVICVPLKVRDGPLGALYLENSDITAQFTTEDVALVTTFCDYVALTVSAARGVTAIRKREEQLHRSRERIGRLNGKLKALLRRQSRELAGVRADLNLSRQELGLRYDAASIVGESPAMRKVLIVIDQLLESNRSVLVRGESGSGKETVARVLHYNGPHAAHRLVTLACADVPADLLETQIFAFLDNPQGGTLLLDEVEALSDAVLNKMASAETTVRVVGTSINGDIDAAARFRDALKVVDVALPPLRERPEDVLPLFEHFLDTLCAEQEVERPDVQPALIDRLHAHTWPGNVRELRAEVSRLLTLHRGVLSPELLSLPVFSGDPNAVLPTELPAGGLKEMVEHLEKRVIADVLERESGNKTRTAAALGLSRLGLRKKIERYGLAD